MKQKIKQDSKRDKAFIGAAIGAVTGIAGGIINGRKQRKAEKEALKAQQIEQNKEDTLEAAQAMSSSYANQDYTEDYGKKITLRMGGNKGTTAYADRFEGRPGMVRKKSNSRKKAALGSGDITDIIKGVGTTATTAINTAYGNPQEQSTNFSALDRANKIGQNKDIAKQIQLDKEQGTNYQTIDINNQNAGKKFPQSATARMGTIRKKKFIGGIGDAAGGVGSLVGSFFNKSKPKTVKSSDGTTTSAPKTGLVDPNYNINNDINTINTIDNTNNPIYRNRLDTMKCGGKKSTKRVK